MLTPLPKITRVHLRVLATILRMRRQNKKLTVRAIAIENGDRWHGYVWEILVKLRNAGMIGWNERACGTIQPWVRWIPASKLEEVNGHG